MEPRDNHICISASVVPVWKANLRTKYATIKYSSMYARLETTSQPSEQTAPTPVTNPLGRRLRHENLLRSLPPLPPSRNAWRDGRLLT